MVFLPSRTTGNVGRFRDMLIEFSGLLARKSSKRHLPLAYLFMPTPGSHPLRGRSQQTAVHMSRVSRPASSLHHMSRVSRQDRCLRHRLRCSPRPTAVPRPRLQSQDRSGPVLASCHVTLAAMRRCLRNRPPCSPRPIALAPMPASMPSRATPYRCAMHATSAPFHAPPSSFVP